MNDIISPYALLCACKPHHAPTMVTPYDLYSAAQNQTETMLPQPSNEVKPEPKAEAPRQTASAYPQKRTHYIQDIHSRHNRAAHGLIRPV